MYDEYFRLLSDRLLGAVARRVGTRLHPNAVTVAALIVGLASAVAAARAAFATALILWFGNRLLDGFDGPLARATGQQSDFGGYLDIVLDFVVYGAVPLGLVLSSPLRETALMGACLVATFYVNAASWMYLSAILERRASGASRTGELTTVTMPPGLVAGTETVVFYSLFLLFPTHLSTLFALMAALVLVTAAQRVWWARRTL